MTVNRKPSIILTLFLIVAIIISNDCLSCSMIKITKNGKTIVGNNEDQMNPNTKIWFETSKNGGYGVVYVGFDNLYPQGGMNEVGLVFDGFSQSYREVKDTIGKKIIAPLDLEKLIMQKCSTVEDVKNLFSQYNRSTWSSAVLRFVDRSGKCLYVDGDSLIISDKDIFIQTNVRPYENKKCWRFDKAARLLSNNYEATTGYCKSIMDSVHQEGKWGGTLYTTVYDLDKATIDLYYFHDFKNVIKFDLKEELKKGDKILDIPQLFPNNDSGMKYYTEYNKILTMIKHIGDSLMIDETQSCNALKDSINNSFIERYAFISKIFNFGQYYLNENVDIRRAILFLKLYAELLPEYWKAYDILGDAYMKDKQFQLALNNYKRSVEIKPDNISGKKQIQILNELIEK